jgi:hypothetical protein
MVYAPLRTELTRDLIIDDNKSLQNLEGLSGLTTVTGDFRLENNKALNTLSGLSLAHALVTTIQDNDGPCP